MLPVLILWGAILFILQKVKEPPSFITDIEENRDTLGALQDVFRQDRDFAWFIVLRSAAGAALTVMVFHYPYVSGFWEEAPNIIHVGSYAGIVHNARLAGHIVMGIIIALTLNRSGSIKVIRLCLLAAGAGLLLIPFARSFYLSVILAGLIYGFETASLISTYIARLEFGKPHNRTAYIAIALIAFALVPVIVSLSLTDKMANRSTFLAAGAVTIIAALLMGLKVRDPRKAEYRCDNSALLPENI